MVVTATAAGDATVPDDAQREWTFEGVRDCADDVPVEVVPQAPTGRGPRLRAGPGLGDAATTANAPVRGAFDAEVLAATGADPRLALLTGVLLLLGGTGLVLLARRTA